MASGGGGSGSGGMGCMMQICVFFFIVSLFILGVYWGIVQVRNGEEPKPDYPNRDPCTIRCDRSGDGFGQQ